MKVEDIIAAIERYGAGYLYYLLDLFRPADAKEAIALSRGDARLLVFSAISAASGSVLYATATGENFDTISLASAQVVVAAAIFWGLLALIAHLIVGRSRNSDFAETLSAILRVLPGAFVLAAAAAFAARRFSLFMDEDSRQWLAAFAFLGVQLALLAIALPASLARLDGVDRSRRVAASGAVIFAVFLLNFLTVYMGGSPAQAQTPSAAETEASPQPSKPWWCFAPAPCPKTPGSPTGKYDSESVQMRRQGDKTELPPPPPDEPVDSYKRDVNPEPSIPEKDRDVRPTSDAISR